MWRDSRPDGAAALVVTAGALAYANAFLGGFQFDDWNVIVGDPRVQSLPAWRDAMPGIRPLLKLSYALNHASGAGLAGFHAVNLAIHLANGLLALALMRRWRAPVAGSVGVAAAVAALLFTLHPVQTEAVTYLSGRSTSLAACFALASLLAWDTGRERGRTWLSHGLSPALFACALATRETAAVLPLALLLWRATAGERGGAPGALRATAAHWLVLMVAAVVVLVLPDYQRFFAASIAARPWQAQALTQFNALGYLAGQVVRPDRLNADPMLPVMDSLAPGLVLRAVLLLAALVTGAACLRRRPAVAFALLWFLLWLAPTNSLLPRLDVANDRQLYLALLGPAWLAGLALAWLAARRRALAAAVALAVTLGLAWTTVARNRVYVDEQVFWEDVVAKTPGNSRAWNNLGYALAIAGQREAAERALLRALAADPANARAAVNLVLLRAGSLGPAAALRGTAAGSRRASSP